MLKLVESRTETQHDIVPLPNLVTSFIHKVFDKTDAVTRITTNPPSQLVNPQNIHIIFKPYGREWS